MCSIKVNVCHYFWFCTAHYVNWTQSIFAVPSKKYIINNNYNTNCSWKNNITLVDEGYRISVNQTPFNNMYLYVSVGFLRSFTHKILYNIRTEVCRFALAFRSSYNKRPRSCRRLVIDGYSEMSKTETNITPNKTQSKNKPINREKKIFTVFFTKINITLWNLTLIVNFGKIWKMKYSWSNTFNISYRKRTLFTSACQKKLLTVRWRFFW